MVSCGRPASAVAVGGGGGAASAHRYSSGREEKAERTFTRGREMSAVGAVPIWCCWSARKLSPARSSVGLPHPHLPKRPFAAHRRAPSSIVGSVSAGATEKAVSSELTLQAGVSQVVVRTMKDLYGRGPTHAKTYICDEYVFCVMSGGMTRDEETMI